MKYLKKAWELAKLPARVQLLQGLVRFAGQGEWGDEEVQRIVDARTDDSKKNAEKPEATFFDTDGSRCSTLPLPRHELGFHQPRVAH